MIEVARLYRVENGSSLKAFVDVLLNEQVLVKGVRVLGNRDGNLFVKMPTEQGKDGTWYETVRLLNDELKQELKETVLEAFNV